MKVSISNFGPIRECSFDLTKNFSLVVGGNNIGKSYSISLVYLIIKNFNELEKFLRYAAFEILHREDILNIGEGVQKTIKNKKKGGENDCTYLIAESVKRLLDATVFEQLKESLNNTFDSIDSLHNAYSGEEFSCKIDLNEISITFGFINGSIETKSLTFDRRYIIRNVETSRSQLEKKDKTILYNNLKNKNHALTSIKSSIIEILSSISKDISTNIGNVYYLPASRSGLYKALTAFGQIVAELSKSRSFVTKKIELPGLPEPVSDYFLALSEIRSTHNNHSERIAETIAQEIEKNILKGEVDYDMKARRITYSPTGTDLELDLSSTSSMVSELSPIVTFFRYIVERKKFRTPTRNIKNRNTLHPKPLIIIEEPEAHLHPLVQIQLTEIFSKLVSKGAKIVITSHSNYIFSKLNNLILAGSIPPNNTSAIVFKNTPKGSIGIDLEIDDLGIDDDNFLDVTEKLIQEKLNLIEEMNSGTRS